MRFRDDFDEVHLLFAKPVCFDVYEDEKQIPLFSFKLKIPTFGDYYFNSSLKQLIGFLNSNLSEIQTQFSFLQDISSHFSLLYRLSSCTIDYIRYFLNSIEQGFKELDINMKINNGIFINDYQISYDLFNKISQIILIALALKKKSDFVDDPQMKVYQDKINKIKKSSPVVADNGTNFKDAYITLIYEFGYTQEAILNMTQYAMNIVLSYTGKSIRYKTTLIAAGNGNTKKVKFITDKGK